MIPIQRKIETLAWFGVFFVLCGMVVWVRTSTVKATYQYVQHEKELSSVASEIQGDRIRWLKLTAPKKLEALAEKFELSPADSNQRIQYQPKGSMN
jgi:hypothetical protein